MEFYWLAVFELFTAVPVAQGEDTATELLVQAVAQKWSLSGAVAIAPGQTTESVISQIVAGCKESGNIPVDALLVDITILPNVLVPATNSS